MPAIHLEILAAPLTPFPTSATQGEINLLAGPRLIGLLFNWGLLGVLTTQVYVYYLNFPNDRWPIKVLLTTVYILDWVQTGSATSDAFDWFVYGYGSIPKLYGTYESWLNVPTLSSLIALMVQCYFAWRIKRFTDKSIVPALIVLLACMQMGGGIGVAYFLWTDPNENSRMDGLLEVVGVRLGTSALVDIVIAISMTYYLLKSRAFASSQLNNALTKVIRLTVETGTFTAFMAIIDLIFFLTQHNGMHQVSGVTLCKIYSNTLLVSLNHRIYIQKAHLGPAGPEGSAGSRGDRGSGGRGGVEGGTGEGRYNSPGQRSGAEMGAYNTAAYLSFRAAPGVEDSVCTVHELEETKTKRLGTDAAGFTLPVRPFTFPLFLPS